MAIIFITGLSGVGKTTTLEALAKEGYHVVETDVNYTTMIETDQGSEIGWDEQKIKQLIQDHQKTDLFISGCYANQGKFYSDFDSVVLLDADWETMVDRIDKRANNPYGKTKAEKSEILNNYEHVLPLLKKSSDLIIDTSNNGIDHICHQLKTLL